MSASRTSATLRPRGTGEAPFLPDGRCSVQQGYSMTPVRTPPPAGDRREDRDDVAVLHLGLERPEVPHVLVVHVDVDEAVEASLIRHDAFPQAGMPRVEVREDVPQRRALPAEPGLAAGMRPKDRRDLD